MKKLTVCFFFLTIRPLLAIPIQGRISDEIESTGGHSLGFSNGGIAATSDLSSIRTNPAMLAIEKQYQLSASYHWPTYGREFYQAGVIDSKTSAVAAGILYTGIQKKYAPMNLDPEDKDINQKIFRYYDSPIHKRIALGVGYTLEKLALGIGGQYMEFYSPKKEKDSGTSLSLGLAGLITPTLRFGLSGENLTGQGIKDVAPKTYRGGLAYVGFDGLITLHLDWKKRERVAQESLLDEKTFMTMDLPPLQDEQTLTGSFSVKFQDLLRLVGAYGQGFESKPRQFISGGIAVVQQNFSLSYLVGQPYLNRPESRTHQAINLAMNMAL